MPADYDQIVVSGTPGLDKNGNIECAGRGMT